MFIKHLTSLINKGKNSGPRAPGKTFDILCIGGVGPLSLYGATILELMEQEAGEPLARKFHLISGTSVGAFMALALSREYPAKDLTRLLTQRSYEIYNSKAQKDAASEGKVESISKQLWKAKCDPRAWRSLMAAALGENTLLKEIMHPVLIPTYDITIGKPRLYGAPFSLSGYGQENISVMDIAMAATATPALFPIAELSGQKLVDGIVISPLPDAIVLREAIHRLDASIESIRMTSIGTLTGRFRLPHGSRNDLGLLSWSAEGKLQALIMAAQQQSNTDLMKDLLGDRYCLIDTIASDEKGLPHPLTADNKVVERATKEAELTWRRINNDTKNIRYKNMINILKR